MPSKDEKVLKEALNLLRDKQESSQSYYQLKEQWKNENN